MAYGKLWPARPRPLPDELLTSWWFRLARANGIKLQPFSRLVLNTERTTTWNVDLDKSVKDETLKVLARNTGIPLARVRQMPLGALKGRLFRKFNVEGVNRWILQVGVFHAARLRPGMQCCPTCLREDEIPYYRRIWRLSFVTICPVHWIPLIDRCPKCQAPIVFHRREFGQSSLVSAHPMTLCQACDHDLRNTDQPLELHKLPIPLRGVPRRGLGLQRRTRSSISLTRLGYIQAWLLQTLERDRADLADLNRVRLGEYLNLKTYSEDRVLVHPVKTVELFDFLHCLVGLCATDCGNRGGGQRKPAWVGKPPDPRRVLFCFHARKRVGVRKTISGTQRVGPGFAFLPVEDRLVVMKMLAYVISHFPTHLIELSQKSGMTASRIARDLYPVPKWVSKALEPVTFELLEHHESFVVKR
jgi:TniQ